VRSPRLPPVARHHCSDDEFETYISELTDSPACGPCVLIADYLRFQAIVALERSQGRVDPPTVREGWAQLRGTRWGKAIDLDRFLSRDFSRDKYDALMFQADQHGSVKVSKSGSKASRIKTRPPRFHDQVV
jgi:hypothetical protein